MKKLILVFLALIHLGYAQQLDSLRAHYEKDLLDCRANDSIQRASKQAFGDSLLGIRLMALHILPTRDAITLIRLLNPTFGSYPYYSYDTTNISLPVIPRLKGKELRQWRRSLRRDRRSSPQFEAIFGLQLDTLLAIRRGLTGPILNSLHDDSLVNRLIQLDKKKINKGRLISSYIEDRMDELIDQYRALRGRPLDNEPTIKNIGFVTKLVIRFLAPIDSIVPSRTASEGWLSWPSHRSRHLGLATANSSSDDLVANRLDPPAPTHAPGSQSERVTMEFYVFDSTSVRYPANVLTDSNMQSRYVISWRLPLDDVSTPILGRASKVTHDFPIVDHYFSAFKNGKKTVEELIDLDAYLKDRPLQKHIKNISPYIILINIHNIRHS